jgi:hypothetical protein
LAQQHQVTNLAQAGVGEHKIYRQLVSVDDLTVYDVVIVAHTNPGRVPTRRHPMHYNDGLHQHADLIYSDIDYHAKQLKNIFNVRLHVAREFFRYHYDDEFFEDTYWLFREKINTILADKKVITLETFDLPATEKYVLNFADLLNTNPGLINHYSEKGNQVVFDTINATLKTLSKEIK